MMKRKTNEARRHRRMVASKEPSTDDQPPLVKGGQGRTAEELVATAGCVGWILATTLLWGIIVLIWWGIS